VGFNPRERGGESMKIEIRNRFSDKIIVSDNHESIKDCLEKNRGADLRGADLRGADLRGADLGGTDLRDADLGGTYLRGAYLRGAYLRGADLGGADLRGADLGGADLRDADLRGADLRGADLGGADLRGADLGGTHLRGAYLRGAYLRGAKNYSENPDFFQELVKGKQCKEFTEKEWSMIGRIVVHRICWGAIKNKFGKDMLTVFKKLSDDGFSEYFKKYKNVLEG